jgi:hypothetical protein
VLAVLLCRGSDIHRPPASVGANLFSQQPEHSSTHTYIGCHPQLQKAQLTFGFDPFLFLQVLLASKFLDDFYYNNAYWARVGGVGTTELNTLELDMLAKLHFNLHVQTEEYLQYREELLLQHISDVPVSAEELQASRSDPPCLCRCFFAHIVPSGLKLYKLIAASGERPLVMPNK